MSEVEFKTTMKQNAGVYIYRLVDEQGNVLKYTARQQTRLNEFIIIRTKTSSRWRL
jgi:hypothetical protein